MSQPEEIREKSPKTDAILQPPTANPDRTRVRSEEDMHRLVRPSGREPETAEEATGEAAATEPGEPLEEPLGESLGDRLGEALGGPGQQPAGPGATGPGPASGPAGQDASTAGPSRGEER